MAIVRNTIKSSGGGSSIIVVANYSALPDPTTVSGKFYWCENSQGTSWLPGSLGGSYYNAGMYYSNGTSWSFVNVPYQATQAEVDAGTNTDKFVTPKTLNDSNFLKRDGSNANQDVDLGEVYGLKANNVKIQTAGASKSMKILGSNLTNERTAEWQDKDYSAIADLSDIIDALSSFKTTEHLDATSSIQGQINSKQPLLSYTPYKFIQASQTPHTGTIAKTIIATATILPNTFPTMESLNFLFGANKPLGISGYTLRCDINITNTISGATTIATFTGTSTAQVAVMTRVFSLLGGNIYGYPFTTSQLSDSATLLAGALGSTTYNTTNTLYMFWTIQLVNSADSVTPNLTTLTN